MTWRRNRRELSDDFGPNLRVIHQWCIPMELTYGAFWLLATGLSQR